MDSRLEERYIVVKLKDMNGDQEGRLLSCLDNNDIKTVDCVVVESDWEIYKDVVSMVLNE